MIDVTYGVLNYNPDNNEVATAAYIAAVESLATNRSKNLTSEVYLFDQASQPDLTGSLARKHGFNAVTLQSNVGISRGINLLANMARGQYVSLVTSDVTFTPGLDDTLIAALRADPKIYQICPVSDNSSLDHQRAPCAREDGILLQNLVQELTIQFWPRTVFEKIGYFDERWKACYENMDFALRAFLEGGSVVIHQGAFCHHEHNGTTKSGAIHKAYDGYLPMPNGLTHDLLMPMWRAKWPNLERYMNHYETFTKDMDPLRAAMFHAYSKNVYLPYVQEVAY
jgi:GT2 family glycosyltransferase